MSNNEIKLSRKQAAELIEEIRKIVSDRSKAWRNIPDPENMKVARVRDGLYLDKLASLVRRAGVPDLKLCTGEAHSNPHIDNCGVCAPRWGWCGDKIKIT